jgi:hypothetical protein
MLDFVFLIYLKHVIFLNNKIGFYHQIYDVVIPSFDNVRLSYVDTDSVVIQTSSDPRDVMRSNGLVQDNFDLSVYPDDFLVTSTFTKEMKNKNKGKLGTFKDEYVNTFQTIAINPLNGGYDKPVESLNIIIDFVALRAKSYSIFTLNDLITSRNVKNYHDNPKKNKGLKEAVLYKKTHQDFIDVLEKRIPAITAQQVGFHSFNHVILTTTKTLKNVISCEVF